MPDINLTCTNAAPLCLWYAGLNGLEQRWNPMNGALSPVQMEWLQTELQEATDLEINVGIFSHIALHPQTGQSYAHVALHPLLAN